MTFSPLAHFYRSTVRVTPWNFLNEDLLVHCNKFSFHFTGSDVTTLEVWCQVSGIPFAFCESLSEEDRKYLDDFSRRWIAG